MNRKRKFLAIALACAMLMGTAATTAAIPGSETPFDITVSAAEITQSGSCGENVTYTLDKEGTLTISGTGEMEDYYYADSPFWDNYDIKKVIIEDGVTRIGDYAFSSCSALESITIPDSMTSIGRGAFDNCSSLTSITIPESVTNIEESVLNFCTSLAEIKVDDNNTAYSSKDGVLFDKNKETIIRFPEGNTCTDYTIPDSVTSIGEYAFYCTSLTDITIPDSVTSIGRGAFNGTPWYDNQPDGVVYAGKVAYGYSGYMEPDDTEITLKDDTVGIAEDAFYGCSSITSISIPDSVTNIGDGAFLYCTSLSEIKTDNNNTEYSSQDGVLFDKNKEKLIFYPIGNKRTEYIIPDGVTNIGHSAFSSCSALESITIPDSMTSIGYGAFYSCSSLSSISIPDSVTSIGNYAFSGCTSLTSITLPDSVTSIAYCAFSGCSALESITLPDSVTSIGDYAFISCSALESITIPDSVTSIGYGAFSGCSALTSITIPDGVKSIGARAFDSCTSLTDITIPDSVTSIEDFALGYSYDGQSFNKQPGFTIKGYEGSEAERYANDNGFRFRALGDEFTPGDVNGDGNADIADALFVARADAGLATLTDAQKQAADVNGDGNADIADALFIARVDAGLAKL